MKETDTEDHTQDPDQENVIDQNTDQNQNLRQMNDPLSQVRYSFNKSKFEKISYAVYELNKSKIYNFIKRNIHTLLSR